MVQVDFKSLFSVSLVLSVLKFRLAKVAFCNFVPKLVH
jgi:hypothetical protein